MIFGCLTPNNDSAGSYILINSPSDRSWSPYPIVHGLLTMNSGN